MRFGNAGLNATSAQFLWPGSKLTRYRMFRCLSRFQADGIILFAGRIRLLIGEMPPTRLEQQESSVPFPTLQLTETVL